jgi:hypothetical protein
MATKAEVLVPARTKWTFPSLGLRKRLARWMAAGQLGGADSVSIARYTGARV